MRSPLKEKLRDLLLGSGPVPQLSPVGRRSPQDEVSVSLKGLDTSLDVTHSNVVASLRPLTIGVGVRGGSAFIQAKRKRPTLEFRQSGGSRKLLGRIDLRADDNISLNEGALLLCHCRRSRNYCTSPARFYRHELYQHYGRFRSRGRGDPYNFNMSAPELRRVFVFYICPRPVVLVTVIHEDASNVFPMDLIGPVSGSEFSLALRSTSPAVELMKASRRIALSDVPFDRMSVAYALGKHHKEKSVDW